MRKYSFVTKWAIEAPLADVWQAIYESEQWPQWWKGVLSVKEIRKGNKAGIGSIRVYTLFSPMSYKLSFSLLLTERKDLEILKGNAYGQLEGTGAWYFKEEKGISYIECHWHVATNVKWMNRFSFLLAPAFKYNHAIVMKWGAKSLSKKLGARLLSY